MMSRMNARTVAVAVTLAALLLTPAAAWARADTEQVSGDFTSSLVQLGSFHIDEDGILHVRGEVDLLKYEGGLEGWAIVTVSFNIDPAGNGDLHGTTQFTGTATAPDLELTGSFEGSFDGVIVGGLGVVNATSPKGSGDFEGMKLMLTAEQMDMETWSYTGRILSPKGF